MPDSGQVPLFYAFQLLLEGIFFCPRLGRGAFVVLPAVRAWSFCGSARGRGHGAQHPTCLQKFLPFVKTGELAANNLHFRPISGKKACCDREKQELKWGRK